MTATEPWRSAHSVAAGAPDKTPGPAARPRLRLMRGRALMAGLIALYIAAWGIGGGIVGGPTDLDVFFLPAARIALFGAPLKVYAPRYGGIWPNANGPLSLVPLTAVEALARALGWLDDPLRIHMVVMSTFAVFSLLLAWEGVAAVDHLRGAPVRGIVRLLVYAVFLVCPVLWHGVLFYGHVELPIAFWLTLYGVRALAEGKPGRAGFGLGLGILARSMVVIYVIALGVFLLMRWRWRAAVALTGIAGAVVCLGLLPFYLADKSDLLYSLVVFRGQLLVGGGSIWGLFVGTPLETLGQRADSTFIMVAVAVVAATLALARRDVGPAGRDLYGVLAVCGVCFPLFIKTLWPYYFLDPYIFGAIWWLGQGGNWRRVGHWIGVAVPLFFVGCAALAEADAEITTDAVLRLHLTQWLTGAVLVFLFGFGGWLLLAQRRDARGAAAVTEPVALADEAVGDQVPVGGI